MEQAMVRACIAYPACSSPSLPSFLLSDVDKTTIWLETTVLERYGMDTVSRDICAELFVLSTVQSIIEHWK